MKSIVVLCSLMVAATCWPANLYSGNGLASVRSRRQHGMAFTGIYMKPMIPEEEIYQEPISDDIPVEQLSNIEGSTEINEVVPAAYPEIITEPEKTVTKNKKESDESDEKEDDDDNTWPIFMGKGKGRMPPMSFFPIMFGRGLGRSGGAPEGSVAIANSFSTGRKGMAVSNAFANADPTTFMKRSNIGTQQQD